MAGDPKIIVGVMEVDDKGLTRFEWALLTLIGQLIHNTAKIANAAGMAGCYMEPDLDAMLPPQEDDAAEPTFTCETCGLPVRDPVHANCCGGATDELNAEDAEGAD